MLCDELIAHLAPESGCDIRPVLPRLKQAQKFVLGAEFAAVAEALSEDYSGLVKVFPQCRLPYPETWIEFAQHDRPRFMQAGIQFPEAQKPPKRVGFLCSATEDNLSAWKTHLFWSFEEVGRCGASVWAMQCNMLESIGTAVEMPDDATMERQRQAMASGFLPPRKIASHPGWVHASDATKLAMANHTDFVQPDFRYQIPAGLSHEKLIQYAQIMRELASSDWAGEAPYLLAVIGLLNARNAIETETVEYGKLNRARIKSGKLPLFEHKVLKIARRQVERVYPDGVRHGSHAPMRAHFCRGHFKSRKTGIFFWHPHLRGDKTRGQIEKEYELK